MSKPLSRKGSGSFEKSTTTTAPCALPPGVLAVIPLQSPVAIGSMSLDHLNVRHTAGIREVIAVQSEYRRRGIKLTSVETIQAIADMEALAMAVCVDSLCDLAPGTAETMEPAHDFWTAVAAIFPFVRTVF